MKYTVTRLKDSECWAAERYLDLCHKCRRVEICKLSEAEGGRKVLAKERFEKAKQTFIKEIKRYYGRTQL